MGIYHDEFIHSTANGHWGSVRFKAIMNSAATNIQVHVFR